MAKVKKVPEEVQEEVIVETKSDTIRRLWDSNNKVADIHKMTGIRYQMCYNIVRKYEIKKGNTDWSINGDKDEEEKTGKDWREPDPGTEPKE